MIDLHCHILPSIDDGAADIEESLSMATMALKDGISTVVATPHTNNGVYINPRHEIIDNVKRLNDILFDKGIELRICPGAEVHIGVNMVEAVISGQVLTLNDTGRYLLVEFPFQAVPHGSEDELFRLKIKDITPIIAHAERNMVFNRKPEILYKLISMGCMVQITAASITGELGEEIMDFSHQLLELRMAHVISTDSHNVLSRPPILTPAVSIASTILKNVSFAQKMVTDIPKAILAGEPVQLPEPNYPNPKKKWFFRWFGI